jgi:hypothetical protein
MSPEGDAPCSARKSMSSLRKSRPIPLSFQGDAREKYSEA